MYNNKMCTIIEFQHVKPGKGGAFVRMKLRDVKNGRVVKGVNFEGLHDVSSPVELAAYYSDHGADELVFYDITASAEGRALFTDILCEVEDNRVKAQGSLIDLIIEAAEE